MPWTKKQEQVIKERDKTILVSAAAGSGKTATLVERIYKKITDPDHPMDITDFLVVTFTKAAATQMKEKLNAKLEAALTLHPENEHIASQNILLQNADITTIDSFCLSIVREYFSFLDLDPSVNLGDPGMMEMLKYDVMTKLFESKYEQLQQSEEMTDFELLLEMFCDGKTDSNLRDIMDKIYRQLESAPNPERFLQQARKALDIQNEDDLNQSLWMQGMFSVLHRKAKSAIELAKVCECMCESEDGPFHYKPQIEADLEKLEMICAANSYCDMKRALEIKWEALSKKRPACDKEIQNRCKDIRNQYKAEFSKIDCFEQTVEVLLDDIKWQQTYIFPLLDLVREFVDLFMEEKLKRKMLEFSDISHMAYRLVCNGYDENGCALPTELGKSIGARYKEIYIDEYQDSNYLQEDILTAVSGTYRREHNMFMVGDVKQSIYRFRMACPEIFVNKYNRFQEEGSEIKIELNHNFRSRAVCLDVINFFFYQLMGEDLGGITYDKNHALVAGKEFPKPDEGCNYAGDVELLFADPSDQGGISEEVLAEYNNPDKDTLEGYMIANRIRELTDPQTGMYIYDEETGTYRIAQYRDIVILSRSLKEYGDVLYHAISSQGIPVYLEKSKGYFHAVEIQVILSMLAVVDNSRQDIPLSAVLLSPIGKLDESELAQVCGYVSNRVKKKLCLYDTCDYYIADCEDSETGRKLECFFSVLEELKRDKMHMSVSDLIWKMLMLTGYYEYASAMPAGDIRKSNIDMLLEKAIQFENGYYKGLFHFLRYVEKLKLIELDEGEASLLSEDANVVRIMSIHKSKGLEFPIVFTAGLGKRFNRLELSDTVLVHPDYYLAALSIHPKERYKHDTALRSIYGYLADEELTAELLRILYVAMTRAKEKLILTGSTKDVTGYFEKAEYVLDTEHILLPYSIRKNACCYMQHIAACMIRYKALGEMYGIADKIQTHILNVEQIVSHIERKEIQHQLVLSDLKLLAKETEPDEFYENNKKSYHYQYPFELLTQLSGKISVSDIKKMKAFDGERYDLSERFRDTGSEKKTDGLTGAERGTIVHKFMELLPFEALKADADVYMFVKTQKAKLLEEQVFDERQAQAISVGKITKMLQSDLGCRMIEAALKKMLYKERQFSACIPVSEVYDVQTDEVLVVQGIIDAYFYEGDTIVLMDYKTDAVDEETLVGLYKAQIETYAEIIEQLTGKRVKEKLFYSFYLDKEIMV